MGSSPPYHVSCRMTMSVFLIYFMKYRFLLFRPKAWVCVDWLGCGCGCGWWCCGLDVGPVCVGPLCVGSEEVGLNWGFCDVLKM